MRPSLSSTSTRTFLALPAVVAAEQALSRRPVHRGWAPLLAAGWLAYRLAGSHRLPRAGGPPGMSQGMPDQLVTDGPYALIRNPMYAGHVLFMAGLALLTRSPVAAVVAVAHLPWFARRVRRDEERLLRRFGEPYAVYGAAVPRWLPRPRTVAAAARARVRPSSAGG